ncbi:Tim44/TimA family putative adaptor protein [Tistrella bauzanensis]|uniref:Tim44/TimA family putative adaptor protein n=1 Tax=Tistrella TaxID=171436 RepID=UPI0031F6C56C
MEYLDILFFALVAVFVALRLRGVLGTRTGHERPPEDKALSRRNAAAGAKAGDPAAPPGPARVLPFPMSDSVMALIDEPAREGIEYIRRADRNFDPKGFLDGAQQAFEMVLDAFARGDKQTLEMLLSPQVMAGFSAVIDEREAEGQTHSTRIVSVREPRIAEARLAGSLAQVTVRFSTTQINQTLDNQDRVIAGGAEEIDLIDLWTFERDTRSSDPNWMLTATRSGA